MSLNMKNLRGWLVGREIKKVYRKNGILALTFEDDTVLIIYTETFAMGAMKHEDLDKLSIK